jgi:hypothetical protein
MRLCWIETAQSNPIHARRAVSKELLTFLLSELNIVRVICQSPHCGAVIEVRTDNLYKTFQECACPVCKASFTPDRGAENPFRLLALALDTFSKITRQVDLEFVLQVAPAAPTRTSGS